MTTHAATFEMVPIGYVTGGRTDIGDTDHWGGVVSVIEVDERFGELSLAGLEDFSHVEVVFVFDQLPERDDYRQPRTGRGRDDLPAVGVFCDHGPRRPNRIGVSFCRVVSAAGRSLQVQGLDAVDATPVLDIKPAMREFLPDEVVQPEWVGRLMADYQ